MNNHFDVGDVFENIRKEVDEVFKKYSEQYGDEVYRRIKCRLTIINNPFKKDKAHLTNKPIRVVIDGKEMFYKYQSSADRMLFKSMQRSNFMRQCKDANIEYSNRMYELLTNYYWSNTTTTNRSTIIDNKEIVDLLQWYYSLDKRIRCDIFAKCSFYYQLLENANTNQKPIKNITNPSSNPIPIPNKYVKPVIKVKPLEVSNEQIDTEDETEPEESYDSYISETDNSEFDDYY